MTEPPTGEPTARIVVVDDEPTNVALLERMLARGGYTNVVGYADPLAALAGSELRGILGRANRLVVVEMTEHAPVADYPALKGALDRLGDQVRTAVDDAGAGYSSFRHIVELEPDFVKIDIGLVRSIERDRARQAFVAGLDYFALKTGCTLIAEGIETEAEREALRSLAVSLGQGYLLGRPGPLPN